MAKSKKTDDFITGINRLIHEPARFVIIAHLYVLEKAEFLFILNQTGLTRGNLSSHMSKLEEAAYIKVDKEFVGKIPKTFLSLTNEGRSAFETYKAHMKQVFKEF